ncbi:MAG: hypothetical protein K0M55_19075 [Rhizobium sp.]|nr:hypothetical protein [Rhizobium sp.]MBW8445306.1 hypothetical protein [Arenimonas sp.]
MRQIRQTGYATHSSLVEPRNSNTIVVPIIGKGGSALATIGLTYFKSALAADQQAIDRFAPVLKSAAFAIAEDV